MFVCWISYPQLAKTGIKPSETLGYSLDNVLLAYQVWSFNRLRHLFRHAYTNIWIINFLFVCRLMYPKLAKTGIKPSDTLGYSLDNVLLAYQVWSFNRLRHLFRHAYTNIWIINFLFVCRLMYPKLAKTGIKPSDTLGYSLDNVLSPLFCY